MPLRVLREVDVEGALGPPGHPGVDSALPRLPRAPATPLGDGWPSHVRAVDAPALQDVPAWEGNLWPGSILLSLKLQVAVRFFDAAAIDVRGMWI